MGRIIEILMLLTAASFAGPSLCVENIMGRRLAAAIDDEGYLYHLSECEWDPTDEPCPGTGPFQVFIQPGVSHNTYVTLIIDSQGRIYQSDGSSWALLGSAFSQTCPPCIGTVFTSAEGRISYAVLDSSGVIHLNSSDPEDRRPFSAFPHMPANDFDLFLNSESGTLIPEILAEDGCLYAYLNGHWKKADFMESTIGLQKIESHLDPETMDLAFYGIDSDGIMYCDAVTGSLAPMDLYPCPGEGPWDIGLIPFQDGQVLIAALDSGGLLSLSNGEEWTVIAAPFPCEDNP